VGNLADLYKVQRTFLKWNCNESNSLNDAFGVSLKVEDNKIKTCLKRTGT